MQLENSAALEWSSVWHEKLMSAQCGSIASLRRRSKKPCCCAGGNHCVGTAVLGGTSSAGFSAAPIAINLCEMKSLLALINSMILVVPHSAGNAIGHPNPSFHGTLMHLADR